MLRLALLCGGLRRLLCRSLLGEFRLELLKTVLDDGVFLLVFECEQRQLAVFARVVPVGEQPLLRALAGREHDI